MTSDPTGDRWELVESMKKLILTGFLALIDDPGTLRRLFVAITVSFVMLMLQVLQLSDRHGP